MSHYHYLAEAYDYAIKNSTDLSSQNGAVLVPRFSTQRAYGANHFARGVEETPKRLLAPLKYEYVVHAEMNCILSAAKQGIRIEGAILYCPWFACTNCAKHIIQSGIAAIVGHDSPLHAEHKSWQENVRIADEMLREAGILFHRIKAIFNKSIRFQGKQVMV